MIKKIIGLGLLMVSVSVVHAGSCDHLQGMSKLACEKAANKRLSATTAPKRSVEFIDAQTKITADPLKQVKSPVKKRKMRLPHNRKTARSSGIAAENKVGVPSRHEKAKLQSALAAKANVDASSSHAGATLQDMRHAGVSALGQSVLVSDRDMEPDFIMPGIGEAMASDAGQLPFAGVGDEELYKVY